MGSVRHCQGWKTMIIFKRKLGFLVFWFFIGFYGFYGF